MGLIPLWQLQISPPPTPPRLLPSSHPLLLFIPNAIFISSRGLPGRTLPIAAFLQEKKQPRSPRNLPPAQLNPKESPDPLNVVVREGRTLGKEV